MASYYLHDPGSNIWRGPFDEGAIQQDVANGHIEPTRQVWSGRSTEAPIAASCIPPSTNDSVPDWLKVVLFVGGSMLAGIALGEMINALSSQPKRATRHRLPRFSMLSAEDPEKVAIRRTAKRHLKNGAEVFADLRGWPKPPTLNGHIPDIFAVYEDREIALEFENRNSVSRTHARRQDLAFSSWAADSPKREYEQILVKNGRGGRG